MGASCDVGFVVPVVKLVSNFIGGDSEDQVVRSLPVHKFLLLVSSPGVVDVVSELAI
eukprot:COSAG01_NODE_6999_length_3398_cov_4.459836_2_plen_57_part_00